MVALEPLVSEFTIVGKLEDFVVSKSDRPKYLQLSTEEEEYSIKVAKDRQNVLSQHLQPGCWLKVTGMRKYELHKGKVKYKAYRIELLSEQVSEHPTSDTAIKSNNSKAKVLFCQGSSCWKKGGKTACALLRTQLQGQSMTEVVEIKTTGCLKQCKQGPNLVIMPGRIRCTRVNPGQISALIKKHLL